MPRRPAIPVLLTLFLLGACTAYEEQKVVSQRDPLPDDCSVTVLQPGAALPAGAERLAEVIIDDAGFTTGCDRKTVREKLRVRACRLGGTTVVIREEHDPSLWSTCYRVIADVYHLP